MKIIKYILVAVLFYGCSNNIDLAKYEPYHLQKASIFPSKKDISSNKKIKILIMNIKDSSIKTARQAKLSGTMQTALSSVVSSLKNVSLANRISSLSYQKRLKKEIKASLSAKELGIDVGQSDYIITGKISQASFTSSFEEGHYYTAYDYKGNKFRKYKAPEYHYRSCVDANINILSLPQLNKVAYFNAKDCSSKTSQTRWYFKSDDRNDALVRDAGIGAIKSIRYKIKNFFANKGYISSAKIKDEDIIVKTTIGLNGGAKKGAKVLIYNKKKILNELSGKKDIEEVKIANGVISNQISKNSSWVIIKEAKEKLHIGDIVKLYYKSSFFGF